MKKIILVTGASRGIGRAVAIRLGAAGFKVLVNFKSNLDAAKEVVKSIVDASGEAELCQFDVANRDEAKAKIDKVISSEGPLYGCVHCAGITIDKPFPALEGAEWDQVLSTNLDGAYNSLHPLIMPLIQNRKGGRIVILSSISGITGNRGQANYSASKAGLIGLTKSLAQELAKRKITVNCVAPGLIETEMIQGLPLDALKKMIPMQRLGAPEEVADLVDFLVSDKASYITGQVISINGGMI
ncbi:MAG: 3-oxoacyl-ACP reductase FabG [SAR324 cluster bacterium]|nr:3-oxoacyl-ACP reductase FabG [SAR324 cluster bacterium]